MAVHKNQNITSYLLKMKIGKLILTDLTSYCKAIIINKCCAAMRIDIYVNRTQQSPEVDCHIYKGGSMEKEKSFNQRYWIIKWKV